jgi:hypothetical protein
MMRLISRDQLAEALDMTPDEFTGKLQLLYEFGFPRSQTEDGFHWSVLEILDWVTARQDQALQLVSYLADYLDKVN